MFQKIIFLLSLISIIKTFKYQKRKLKSAAKEMHKNILITDFYIYIYLIKLKLMLREIDSSFSGLVIHVCLDGCMPSKVHH